MDVIVWKIWISSQCKPHLEAYVSASMMANSSSIIREISWIMYWDIYRFKPTKLVPIWVIIPFIPVVINNFHSCLMSGTLFVKIITPKRDTITLCLWWSLLKWNSSSIVNKQIKYNFIHHTCDCFRKTLCVGK